MSLGLSLSNLVAFIVTLGGLIFIHESGHFLMAKLLGIRVEVFSLGFGPRLFGWKRDPTDYRISILPLGGYVKMAGENPGEDLTGSPDEFLSRPKSQRFAVLVMGAGLNIVLAVVIMAVIFMHGVPVPKYLDAPPVVGEVEKGSPAEQGGLQPMDQILKIGDRETRSWNDMQIAIALNPDQRLPFLIKRDGREQTLEITIGQTEREAMGHVGIRPYANMLVSGVKPGSPAAGAGIRDGDQLVSVNGMDVGASLDEISKALAQNEGTPVNLVLRREGHPLTVSLTPAKRPAGGTDPGFSLMPESVEKQYGPAEALVQSFKVNWRSAGILFVTLRKLVVGRLSPRTLSGPIDIYRFTGEAWKGGAVPFFSFMGLVSLQLGIINLLPIPILDGGNIFILLIEGVIRRDLSMMVKERVMQVGLVLLLLIMGTVISLDVYKNFIQ